MKQEYYEYWDLPIGTPDGPQTEEEANKNSMMNRKCTTCTARKVLAFQRGLRTRSFSGIEKKNTSIRKIGYRFRNEWKYTKVYHSWAGGEYQEADQDIERVDKLIKYKPKFGDYRALLPERSFPPG